MTTSDDPADEPTPMSADEHGVESATAERLSDGLRRTVHGELEPDPFPDDADPEETALDVVERHRRQAEIVEAPSHPTPPDA